jgi:hypothetical protein
VLLQYATFDCVSTASGGEREDTAGRRQGDEEEARLFAYRKAPARVDTSPSCKLVTQHPVVMSTVGKRETAAVFRRGGTLTTRGWEVARPSTTRRVRSIRLPAADCRLPATNPARSHNFPRCSRACCLLM